jgi:hypothetical protein
LTLQGNAEALISRLLKQLMQSDKYGERRGAAFGLAGVVKGLGLPSLKKYGVMDSLKAGVEDRYCDLRNSCKLFYFEFQFYSDSLAEYNTFHLISGLKEFCKGS